jgi:hypothetical protein
MSQSHICNERNNTLSEANQGQPDPVDDATLDAKEVASDDPHKSEKVTKLGRENMEPDAKTE